MTPEERRHRWDELCMKIEGLVQEYHDVILDHNDFEDEKPPDWDNILVAMMDWSLVFTIQDTAPSVDDKGYWTLHVEPRHQLPYRTRGLLEERLDFL